MVRSFRQTQLMDSPAPTARFCRRRPSIYLVESLSGFGADLFLNLAKRIETQVRNFPTPHHLHGLNVQVLKEKVVKPGGQFVRQFPMVVFTLIGDTRVRLSQAPIGLLPTITALLLAGKRPVEFGYPARFALEEKRRMVGIAVTVSQEGFQPEVETAAITRTDDNRIGYFLNNRKANPQLVKVISLDSRCLYLAFNGTRKGKLVVVLADTQSVSTQVLPASLGEGEGLVLTYFLETGTAALSFRSASFVVEEELVGIVVALANFLQCLGWNFLEIGKAFCLSQFRHMLHHCILGNVFPSQLIVPPLQGDGVVPSQAGGVYRLVQLAIAPVMIKTILESASDFHLLTLLILYVFFYNVLGYVPYALYVVGSRPQGRQTGFEFGKFAAQYAGGVSFKLSHNKVRRMYWRGLDKNVNMFRHCFHYLYFATKLACLFQKKFLKPFLNFFGQNFTPVLGTPNKVIAKIVHRSVACSPTKFTHRLILSNSIYLSRSYNEQCYKKFSSHP